MRRCSVDLSEASFANRLAQHPQLLPDIPQQLSRGQRGRHLVRSILLWERPSSSWEARSPSPWPPCQLQLVSVVPQLCVWEASFNRRYYHAHADRKSGNIVYNELFYSGMWRDQSDRLVSCPRQYAICAHADRKSGNIVYNELFYSGMWRDQSDRLVCNQYYVMH